MRSIKYLLPLVFLSFLGSVFAVDFSSVPWEITYAKYRLWYEVNLAQNVSQTWIYFEVPKNIIDNILKYCQDHNYTYCEPAFPRVYYYNLTSGEQIQISCKWEGAVGNEPVPFCIVHSYYNFTVYMENLPAGTYYFVVYYPYWFWEDFEDNGLGQAILNSGDCWGDEWCYYSHEDDQHYAKIVSNGWEPTPNKRLEIYTYEINDYDNEWFIIYREVNVTVNPNYPLIAEWDADATHYKNAPEASIIFQFRLKDGSIKSIKYRIYGSKDYRRSELNICNVVDVGKGHVKRDILKDLTQYCGVYASQVDKLEKVYLQVYTSGGTYGNHWTKMWIDNLKIVPGDIVNYYP